MYVPGHTAVATLWARSTQWVLMGPYKHRMGDTYMIAVHPSSAPG